MRRKSRVIGLNAKNATVHGAIHVILRPGNLDLIPARSVTNCPIFTRTDDLREQPVLLPKSR